MRDHCRRCADDCDEIWRHFGRKLPRPSSASQKLSASRSKQSPVVVVSAMAKVTDQLVAMGHKAATGDCEASIGLLQSLARTPSASCAGIARGEKMRGADP